MTRLSNLDGLTGIANRRKFDQTLEIEWNRARLIGTHLSLVLVDIDHFKRLNDAAGHQMGDECLKLIAAELAKTARRATDLVARFGGEEFVLILPGTDPASGRAVGGIGPFGGWKDWGSVCRRTGRRERHHQPRNCIGSWRPLCVCRGAGGSGGWRALRSQA